MRETSKKRIRDWIHDLIREEKTLPWDTINNCFLTLQSVFNQILLKHGSKDYRLLHMGKGCLAHAGNLPRNLVLSQQAMDAAHIFAKPRTHQMYASHTAMIRQLFGEDSDGEE